MSNIINECVIVNVECSIWTAKARLTRDDLDAATVAALPPETLTSLGSKQLVDPQLLKPIIAVKSRMFRYMDTHGVKFLGGWIIDKANVDAVTDELQLMAQDYDAAVRQFLQDYDAHCREWLDQFPQWASILQPALPSEAKLRSKFRFYFQMYTVQPVESSQPAANNNLKDTLSSLGDTALNELAAMLRRLRDETFKPDRTKFTRRAFNAFDDVRAKCRAVSFLHPSVVALEMVLRDMSRIYAGQTDSLPAMQTVGNLLEALADPVAIDRICGKYADGTQNIADVMSPFQAAVSAPAMPQPEPVEAPTMTVPNVASINRLANMMRGFV